MVNELFWFFMGILLGTIPIISFWISWRNESKKW